MMTRTNDYVEKDNITKEKEKMPIEMQTNYFT